MFFRSRPRPTPEELRNRYLRAVHRHEQVQASVEKNLRIANRAAQWVLKPIVYIGYATGAAAEVTAAIALAESHDHDALKYGVVGTYSIAQSVYLHAKFRRGEFDVQEPPLQVPAEWLDNEA